MNFNTLGIPVNGAALYDIIHSNETALQKLTGNDVDSAAITQKLPLALAKWENLEKIEAFLKSGVGTQYNTLSANVDAIDVKRESKGTIEALKDDAQALLEAYKSIASVDKTSIDTIASNSTNFLPVNIASRITNLEKIIATLNNYLATVETPVDDDPLDPPIVNPPVVVPGALAEFTTVANGLRYSGFQDIGVLLYLEDIYYNWLTAAERGSLNTTAAYSQYWTAIRAAEAANHSYTANGVTVEVGGVTIPWNVALVVNPYTAGVQYNNSVAAAGSRTVIATLAISLVEYSASSQYLWPSYKLTAGLGIAGLIWPNTLGYRIPVLQQPYNAIYGTGGGFYSITVTLDAIAKHKDILVLDGEYWGYAPIGKASQAGRSVTFSTNHTGIFTLVGVKASDNPQTADNSNIALYSMLALVSLAGIAVVNRKRAFNN
jgi:hypothetical protein